MDSLREVFTSRLREALAKNQMSQIDFAKALNTSKSTVQNWAQGIAWPNSDKVVDIANLLGVSPSWLMGGEEQVSDAQAVLKLQEKILLGKIPTSVVQMLAEWPDALPMTQLEVIAKVINEKTN